VVTPISKTGRTAEGFIGSQDRRGQLTASDDEQSGQPGESIAEAALYIASLTEELARFARIYGFETLAYLLDLARLEADQISKSSAGSATRHARRQD
jgi:hypothetical protein